VRRLRMSGAILPLLLYTFMTCTGTICLYSYVSGGAGELRNYFTFEILTAPFKLFVSEKKIFHSSILPFLHSFIVTLSFLSVVYPLRQFFFLLISDFCIFSSILCLCSLSLFLFNLCFVFLLMPFIRYVYTLPVAKRSSLIM
jgi:ABC-type siderophore export system fused ATPase/permease subunit